MRSIFEKMLDEMPEPIADLIDFASDQKDIAVAAFLIDEQQSNFSNALSEALTIDGDILKITKAVANKSISKDKAYDLIMNCFYQVCELDINDRIAAYNEA